MKFYWLCLLFCKCHYIVLAQVSCVSSFGSKGKKQVIPKNRINDGYCDCPYDGLDEPNTDACSGSTIGGWAGVAATKDDEILFPCPQQPSLKLPPSRLNDGICDCCDGADETTSGVECPDICDEVLRKEREARALLQKSFEKGHARRLKELQAYQTMVKTTEKELQQVSNEYNDIEKQVESIDKEMETLKHANLKQRLSAFKDTIMSLSHESPSNEEPLKGLLEPLSEEGLVTVIVQACQLAGELQIDGKSAFDSSSTCVPLRLAGLDVGILWSKENFMDGTVEEERLDLSTNTWQDLIDCNAVGDSVCWSKDDLDKNSKNNRRRLMEGEDEDDMHYEDDDMVYDPHWDDEHDEAFADDYNHYNDDEMDTFHSTRDEHVELNQDLLDGVKANAFSAARLSFLNRATHLIGKINDLMKDDDEDEENTDDRLNAPKVDPMALQQVRSTLQTRKESIQRGLKYAVSAEILVKPFEHSHPDLVALAAGTLYHGSIRSSDLWQILAYMTVEFPTHACFSPWTILCPPEVSNENGTPFPPLPIVKAVEQFCNDDTHADASIICDSDASDEEIPTSIHDHYYGYSVIEPRDEDDLLSKAFARLDHVMDRSSIVKLEKQRDKLQSKLDSLSDRMHELEEEMGGRDHSKYGNQGELYSLRDSCHSVQEGKYDYEICIFGRAQQKDHGEKSGTSLGRWNGSEIDQETGLRKLEWTNGAKCWNGPERSATVFVTCGAENKVLSAEEPDTCRYVLEMESYIACDDEYKEQHGL